MVVYCITMNTNASTYLDIWIKTARYFNYHPIVVGVGTKWMGWKHRTRVYYAAIKDLNTDDSDLVMLCDSGDVFFAGPAVECRDKFLAMKTKMVIGAETACCTGDMTRDRRKKAMETLSARNHGIYMFPNGGVLMGHKTALLDCLRVNSDQSDDQAGYLKMFLKNTGRFKIDDQQSIFGNVHLLDIPLSQYYSFDTDRHRYRNRITGETPCVLHFPGKNFDSYHQMIYTIDFPFLSEQYETLHCADRQWSLYALLIAMVVVVVIIAISSVSKR